LTQFQRLFLVYFTSLRARVIQVVKASEDLVKKNRDDLSG
jgi:hypothetical protein